MSGKCLSLDPFASFNICVNFSGLNYLQILRDNRLPLIIKYVCNKHDMSFLYHKQSTVLRDSISSFNNITQILYSTDFVRLNDNFLLEHGYVNFT